MEKKKVKKSKTTKAMEKAKKEKAPIRLNLASGSVKKEGFENVDISPLEGVDHVVDLFKPGWPWADNSVEEVICENFIEHVPDLMAFMNELHRILKVGGKATIVAPYYSSVRAWQDPTHVRAISEMTFLYYNQEWRKNNGLTHYPITADFDFTYGYNVSNYWMQKNEEARNFAITHYINVISDIVVNLTKKGAAE